MIPREVVLAAKDDVNRALSSLVVALADAGDETGMAAVIESSRAVIDLVLIRVLDQELSEATTADTTFLAHTDVVATFPDRGVCVSCRKAGTRSNYLACERCGAPFHDKCYWKRVATRREHRAWRRDPDPSHVFLCQGCRS